MKKEIKKICLILVLFILGQYFPVTVQAVTSLTEESEKSSVPLLYTFAAEADVKLKSELPNLLSSFSHMSYKVLQPVKLVVYENNKVREDAYYPVVAGEKLITLIRFNSSTYLYELEHENIVNQIYSYKQSQNAQIPTLFLEFDNQVLGKNAENIVNFTTPEMSQSEIEQLCSNVNTDNLKLAAVIEMYSSDLFFSSDQKVEKNEETVKAFEDRDRTDFSKTVEKAPFLTPDKQSEASDSNIRTDHNDSLRSFASTNALMEKDYVSGLTISSNRKDKPDFLMPQKDNGYSYLNTYNGYYIVEKTKNGEYRYGPTGSLALHARGDNYELEWWSGRTNIDDRPIEMKADYQKTYENSPIHPWQDKSANEIMNWLNYWTTSEFTIVKSENMLLDTTLIALNEAEIEPSPNKENSFYVVSRKKLEERYEEKDYISGLTISSNRKDKPDFLMPQKDNGYSYLNTYNGYYIVEKTKNGEYRYGPTGSLALHARGDNYELEWWSGYSTIEDRPIEMKADYQKTYQNSPIHPWQDKSANEIMNWLNYWSTSEFMIVKTSSISTYVNQLNNGVKPLTFNRYYSEKLSTGSNNHYAVSIPRNGRLSFEINANSAVSIQLYDKKNKKIKTLGSVGSSGGIVNITQDLFADSYYLEIKAESNVEYSLVAKDNYFTDNVITVSDNPATGGLTKIVYINGIPNEKWTQDYNRQLLQRGFLGDIGQFTKKKFLDWSKGIHDTTSNIIFGVQQGTATIVEHTVSFVNQNSLQLSGIIAGSATFLKGTSLVASGIGTTLLALPTGGLALGSGAVMTAGGLTMMFGGGTAVVSSIGTMNYSGVGTADDADDYEASLEEAMANPSYKEYGNIDCEEIAEDFVKVNPKGTVYNIVASDGGEFNVWEYGKIKRYVYHVAYSYKGLIYDPRYSPIPVHKDQYFRELQRINSKKLNVYEISL